MKLIDARRIMTALTHLQQTELMRKPKFAYFLAKNKRVLEQVEKDFNDALRNDHDQKILDEWDQERLMLIHQLAKKDAQGNPIMINNIFQFEDEPDAVQQIQKLLESHPEARRALEEQNQKINELNDKDEDINLSKLPVSEWPELPQTLSPELLDALCLLMTD